MRDLIPGAREVVEIDEGKLFFPEERPGNWPFNCAATGDADHHLVLDDAATTPLQVRPPPPLNTRII